MRKSKTLYVIFSLIIIIAIILIYNGNKILYTKEFSYLPKYKNMQVETFEEAKDGQFGNAVYTLKKVKYENFLNSYEKVFLKDGWQVTQDKKPESIEVTKGEHIARIDAVNSKDYITILIWTK